MTISNESKLVLRTRLRELDLKTEKITEEIRPLQNQKASIQAKIDELQAQKTALLTEKQAILTDVP